MPRPGRGFTGPSHTRLAGRWPPRSPLLHRAAERRDHEHRHEDDVQGLDHVEGFVLWRIGPRGKTASSRLAFWILSSGATDDDLHTPTRGALTARPRACRHTRTSQVGVLRSPGALGVQDPGPSPPFNRDAVPRNVPRRARRAQPAPPKLPHASARGTAGPHPSRGRRRADPGRPRAASRSGPDRWSGARIVTPRVR